MAEEIESTEVEEEAEAEEVIDENTPITIADEFPFLETDDQKLRFSLFSYMANAEIDGRILVTNLEMAFNWVKDGAVPPKPRKLKVVEGSSDG